MTELPYIRCKDLDGELWTIPSDSWLHTWLSTIALSFPEPYLPTDFCRQPRTVQLADVQLVLSYRLQVLRSCLAAFPFLDQAQQREQTWPVFRLGQSVRAMQLLERNASAAAHAVANGATSASSGRTPRSRKTSSTGPASSAEAGAGITESSVPGPSPAP